MTMPKRTRTTKRPTRIASFLIAAAALGAWFAPALIAQDEAAQRLSNTPTLEALGSNATIYRLRSLGQSGELLDSTSLSSTSYELEVLKMGEEPQFLEIPGTEDLQEEKAPNLSYSAETGTLLIVWEDVVNSLHSRIKVVSYHEAVGFTDVLELVGNPFYAKRRPQVLLTTDSAHWRTVNSSEDGDTVIDHQLSQRVNHLTWREDQGHVFYSALAEGSDGAMASTGTVNLSSLLPSLSDAIEDGVDGTLTLSPGRDHRSALISFVDPLRRRLETVEISSVAIEASILADEGFERVAASEHEANSGLVGVSEAARSHIVWVGRQLTSDTTTEVFSRAIAASVLDAEDTLSQDGWVGVAEQARSHIVWVGRGLSLDRDEIDIATALLPLSLSGGEQEAVTRGGLTATEPTVNLVVSHLASRSLPEEAPAESQILVSTDAARAVVSWHTTDPETGAVVSVSFAESTSEGWSPVYELAIESAGSLAKAESLLRSRFRNGR